MSALALALALRLATAQATDGGVVAAPLREVDEVKTGSLELADGRHLDVDGGAYMPEPSLVATGKELAQLRAENAALKSAPPDTRPVSVIVAVAAFVLGGALGAGLVLASKH